MQLPFFLSPQSSSLPASSMAAPPLCASRNNFLSPTHHHQLHYSAISHQLPSLSLKDRRNFSSKRHRFVLAVDSSSSSSQSSTSVIPDKSLVPDDQFSLSKISFGVVGLGSGLALLAYGFGAYFTILPGAEWSALMLTYGFPVAVIGMALKYAELKPVPCLTYADAQLIREKCSTPVLNQVKTDVTRFRYGDEQHLDEALKRIFQYGQGGGISRRSAPVLQMIREEVTEDGKYCLVLVFEAKTLQLSDFEKRQAKFASFFGPGITAEVGKGANDLFEVRLISNTQA